MTSNNPATQKPITHNPASQKSATGKEPSPKKPKKNSAGIRERNERLILDAAEIVFIQHGFKGATTQAIADVAGLPKANVHYYFKSKKKLYKQLLTNIINEWNSGLDGITPDSDPETVLRQFIQEKIKLSFTHKNRAKIFALEVVQGAPHFSAFIENEMKSWVDEKVSVMQTWVDSGKLKIKDPRHLLFWIWATTQRYAEFDAEILVLQEKNNYTQADIDLIINNLTDFILRGCGLIN